MSGPLSHIRVLDLSRVLAGPFAGQILADLGADVIKVERPAVGDDTRHWGPPFLTDADGERGDAGYFLAANRGKRSVQADLADPDGQALVRSLARSSDVVLENYKTGSLAKWGLGYADLAAIRPDIIYCSITGFGQTGPRAGQAAYDFMIQAMGGLMSVTGEADGYPGAGPQKVGIPVVDLMTGMYAAIGVLAALARRAETGEGEYIDLAMLDVMVGSLANQAMNFLVSGNVPRRAGNKHPNIQPQDVFPCRDGHVVVVVGNDGQYAKFCEAIGRPDLAADPDFATNGGRVRNQSRLLPQIIAALAAEDMAVWVARLEAAGVPCAPINTAADAFADPQVAHREMLVHLDHPVAGSLPMVASPLRFANAPIVYDRAPPLLGEHDEEIRREAGPA
ncbi:MULTISPECIES: CaiB/BaiF CoA transferase family protein [unclassified Sphingomonas]|uniref:CaiB/BaiF CoA transferase family protein n=1 Tax=unclassified Sphingomonas TaxID=196159 RepID=UPI0006FA39A2|nr:MULTISPECIES: CoA transferase [unclassified Sphingomonas]KQX25134.1 CoA-transferase [Sphingomonas sp. Root1294]KQY66151.1 CoA-transferase [Sphingomonas sp. Root50]KRB89683.1 CoA-transferase [Sphingomonas sp. Root720]